MKLWNKTRIPDDIVRALVAKAGRASDYARTRFRDFVQARSELEVARSELEVARGERDR